MMKDFGFFKTRADAEAYGKAAEPETNPVTGDNSVFFFTAVAVVMLSAVVVMNKKKVFSK